MSAKEMAERRAKAKELLLMNPLQRAMDNLPLQQQDIAAYVGISPNAVTDIKRELNMPEWDGSAVPADFANMTDDQMEKLVVGSLVAGSVLNRNSQAGKVVLQYLGKLVEKQEVTHKVNGGDIADAFIRARDELRRLGYGVDDVPDEPGVLPPELRIPPGQGEGTDTTV